MSRFSKIALGGLAALGTVSGLWHLKKVLKAPEAPKDQSLALWSTNQCTNNVNHAHSEVLPSQKSCEDKSFSKAISRSRVLIKELMMEAGVPGAQVAVSVNGQLIWSEGLGLSDVENHTPCTPDSIFRIASISKSLTAVALLQLWEKGLVDLDAPVQNYVPEFPEKSYDGESVVITTRQLLSHMSGIRHYSKKGEKAEGSELKRAEYYISKHYKTIEESLKLFADDQLLTKPGDKFNYSTHAWTLISAVIEKVSGKKFLPYMRQSIFSPLDMSSTGGEFHKPLLYNRGRHYVRDKKGILKNTRYVDLSYKWAGGGLVSTAEDLVKFGNAVLASYLANQHNNNPQEANKDQNFIISPRACKLMLTKVTQYADSAKLGYGLGWFIDPGNDGVVGGRNKPLSFGHSGSAIGASSVLIVSTEACDSRKSEEIVIPNSEVHSRNNSVGGLAGSVVCIIVNLQDVQQVVKLGQRVAEQFR